MAWLVFFAAIYIRFFGLSAPSIICGFVLFAVIYEILGKVADNKKQASPFADNKKQAFPFTVRAVFAEKSSDLPFDSYAIQIRGMPPVYLPKKCDVVVSLIDITDRENPGVVLSSFEDLQEQSSLAFQFRHSGVDCGPGYGWGDWTTVINVAPVILTPPRRGRRVVQAVVRIIDSRFGNQVKFGSVVPGMAYAEQTCEFTHDFIEGYKDKAEEKASAQLLMLRLAVSMASKDGEVTVDEKTCIRRWITQQVESASEGSRSEVRGRFEGVLATALADVGTNRLDFADLVRRLGAIPSAPLKYQAVGLLVDVLAADGEADPNELRAIDAMATELQLDMTEVRHIKDQRLVNLRGGFTGDDSIEALLGINPEMPKDEINRRLRAEFAKWNGRINTLPEGAQRANAQRMLDMIADARRKYT